MASMTASCALGSVSSTFGAQASLGKRAAGFRPVSVQLRTGVPCFVEHNRRLPVRPSFLLSNFLPGEPSLRLGISVARSGCHVAPLRVMIRGMADKDAPVKKKKEDSAKKRARLAEDRRVYNKSRKTEIKTRMKKVFLALDTLKKKGAGSPEEIKPIEALIGEAYSIIDKSVKVGTLHRNTGGNRKSRLARAKRAVEIQLGLYSPTPTA